MVRTIRIAAAQTNSLETVKHTLKELESIAHDAARQGVGLLLFPEAYLGGYPRSCSFGSAIGAREESGRDQFQKYFEAAVDLGDSSAGAGEAWHQRKLAIPKGAEHRGDGTREELERIAKGTGVFLAVGLIERAGSSLYCGAVFVSPEDGMLEEKRRKVMPTGTERLVWAQGNPSTLKAFKTTIQDVGVTIGTAICWESFMPLLRYSLYAQDINLYLAPTADGRDTWLPLLRTIASESRAFVLSCNQVVRQSELPSWVKSGSNRPNSNDQRRRPSSTTSRTMRRSGSSFSHTKEGHEICWPDCENSVHNEFVKNDGSTSPLSRGRSGTASPPIRTNRRKSSIIGIQNGHELCLPLPETGQKKTDDAQFVQPFEKPSHSYAISDIESVGESQPNGNDPMVSRGGSCVVSPFGAVVKEPLWDAKGLVIADVDIDECTRGKFDFDVAGHYSRSDAFKLSVEGLDLSPP
jgi:nitrilase